jgi:uncharacterized protein
MVLSFDKKNLSGYPINTFVFKSKADHAQMLQEKIDLARKFKALDEKKRMALLEKVAGFDGRLVEYHKV